MASPGQAMRHDPDYSVGLGCWSATNDLGQQLRPIHGDFGFDVPASLRPSYLMRSPARGLEQFCGELTTS